MFIIIGGDGKEYGPVTADQIRAWIAGGRANLDTKTKAVGSEEWRRLADFPEFSGVADAPPTINPTATEQSIPAVPSTQLAGVGSRLGARVIDWALELICVIPGALLLGGEFMKVLIAASRGQEPDLEQLDLQRLGIGVAVMGFMWLALLVVQVWMLTTRGQSIGKRLLGVRIVKIVHDENPGIVHAWVLRELLISVIGFVLGIVPFIGPFLIRPVFHLVDWCFIFREDRRCLHDLMAGTKVVVA
jgi:uncharacterized RDD family membrane protein YckC